MSIDEWRVDPLLPLSCEVRISGMHAGTMQAKCAIWRFSVSPQSRGHVGEQAVGKPGPHATRQGTTTAK
jgi:hypothetical protein